MTHTPTSFDDLRAIGLSERDALVAAAVLPHLPNGDALVRIRDEDAPPTMDTEGDRLERFQRRVPTIGGASNLRRCRYAAPPDELADADGDVDMSTVYELDFEPVPHGIRSYRLSLYDVDVLQPADGPPAVYDFDDTDQTTLARWGVGSSVLHSVGARIRPYQYPRKPSFPTYTD